MDLEGKILNGFKPVKGPIGALAELKHIINLGIRINGQQQFV